MTLPKKRPYSAPIGAPEDAILKALSRYHYLTSQQLCRLLYKGGSLSYVQAKLKLLNDTGYCQKLFLPRGAQNGSAPSVYCLGSKGRAYLQSCGILMPRLRASESLKHSLLFLSHTLECNSVVVAAEMLAKSSAQIELSRWEHERSLKCPPTYVQVGAGKRVAVVPDAWLDFRLHGAEQLCIAVEVDRGTEGRKAWGRKIQALLAYSHGPYQERFQTPSLTVAVVATPGDRRMWELLRWTEADLEGCPLEADLFRFTSLPPTVEPHEFFLDKYWHKPFGPAAVSLIEESA